MKPLFAESVIVYRNRNEQEWDRLMYETDFGYYLAIGAVIFIVIVIIACIVSSLKKRR